MKQHGDHWQGSKLIAQAILHDRKQRRKYLANSLFLVLAMMAAGLWLIDGWLRASAWYFLIWWGSCAVITIFVMVFALYDMFAVIREERAKLHTDDDE